MNSGITIINGRTQITGSGDSVRIDLPAGESLDLCLMQEPGGKDFEINLSGGAELGMTLICIGCPEAVNRMRINLNGPHSRVSLNGLYLLRGEARLENHIVLSHNCPECRSSQLFKGILEDKATAVFDALIKVVPGAQKTEAFQRNDNLLLRPQARVHSEPQLEIYADDVKCSHGATNGVLNEDELFYMRSRGISLAQARILQQLSFVGEVIEAIPSEQIRQEILSILEQYLRRQ